MFLLDAFKKMLFWKKDHFAPNARCVRTEILTAFLKQPALGNLILE